MKNAKNTEKDFEQSADKAKDSLISQVNDIIEGAERLLKETAESADNKTSEIRDQLTDKIKNIRESMGEHAKLVYKKGKEAFEVTNSYVNKHPWAAVGIAATAVFIISHLRRRQ